jgi:hypothetical protein
LAEKKYGILDRIKSGWFAFLEKDQQEYARSDLGPGYTYRPDRVPLRVGTERSIIASIITRIGIDASSVQYVHAKLDDEDRYIGNVDSYLNYCLTTEANIDQSSRAFFQDLVESLCDEGVVAVIPEETNKNPNFTDGYDIHSLRTGKILEWRPEHIRVLMYDKRDGRKKDLVLPKRFVAIIQNPLYDVMNEPNSTLRRLVHKLALLDAVDEKASSSKLDLIIHLPYGAKTEVQRQAVKKRRKELENQLENNKYGIIYTDASEKITQLNRPIENHLMEQIEYLTSMLYSQLGMTKEVLEGTADEKTMANYYARTIEPIVGAICDELNRKFLSKTARTQNQKIMFFRDVFRLAPLETIVNAGRDFTSSEIMTPNEVRQKMLGLKPASDEGADQLRNRYVNASGTPPDGEDGNIPAENQNEPQVQKSSTPQRSLASIKVSEL